MGDIGKEVQQPIRDMEVETLAMVVFRCLKHNPKSHPYQSSFYPLGVEDLKKARFPGENRHQASSDTAKFLEAVTLLERRGLVVRNVPGYGRGGNRDQFVIHLTSFGIESNIDDELLLMIGIPEEIVRATEDKQRAGSLDPVVRQYYLESLRAYQEGLYISSVICLGAASERSIHWLAESIESYSEWYQAPMKKGGYWPILTLTDTLADKIRPSDFANDKRLAERLKRQLKGLGDVYRENRNEAGHPQTVDQSWSREDQKAFLSLFGLYITTIGKAIRRASKDK